jgi:stalled ribosome rescue protein Dom34
MSATHAAVWIDHHEAHVFHIDPSSFSAATVAAPQHVPRHHEARPRNHPDDAPRFFRDVIAALDGASEVLVVGPSTAKIHFVDFVHEHATALRVVGMETVDHPTAKQLAAYVRHYFAEGAARVDVGHAGRSPTLL